MTDFKGKDPKNRDPKKLPPGTQFQDGSYAGSQTTDWEDGATTGKGSQGGTYERHPFFVHDPIVRWAQNPKAFRDLARRYKVRIPGQRPDNDEPILVWGRAASFDFDDFDGTEVARETDTVRITGTGGAYVDVMRIKDITFNNSFDDKPARYRLNW